MSGAEKLGLSEKEFEAYLFMASLGPLTEGEIAGLMKISYEDAKAIVSNLENTGLGFVQEGIIKKTGAILPTKELQETLKTFATDVQEMVGTVTKQIKDGQSHLSGSAEQIDNTKNFTLQAIGESFQTLLSQIEKEIVESLNKGNQAREIFVQDAKSKIAQTAELAYQQLASNLAETQQGLTETIEKGKTTMVSSSEEKFQEMQAQLESDQNHVQSSFGGAKDSVSLALGEEKSKIESNLKNLEETGGMMLSGWAGEIEKTLSTFQEAASGTTSTFSTTFTNKLDESATTFDNAAADEEIRETLVTGKETIKTAVSQNQGTISTTLSESNDSITQNLTSQKTALEQTQADSLTKLKETINTNLSDTKTGLEETRSQISNEFGQYDTRSQNLLGESRTAIEKSCEATVSSLVESRTNLETSLEDQTAEYSQEHSKIVNSETERTSAAFQSAIQETIGTLQNLEQTLTEGVNSWRSKVEESSQNFASASLGVFGQTTQDITARLTETIQGIQSNIAQTVSEIATSHSNTTISLKKQIDEAFLKANQIVEDLTANILGSGEEALTALTTTGTALENLAERLQAAVDHTQGDLTASLETMQTGLFEALDRAVQSSLEKMAEVRGKTSGQIRTLKEEQTNAISTLAAELEASTTKTKEESVNSGKSLQEMLQQTISSALAEVDLKTTQTSELIATRLDEQLSDFLAQRNQLNEGLRTATNSLQENLNTTVEEAQVAITQNIDTGKQASKETLDSGAENVVAGTSQLIEGLQATEQGQSQQIMQLTQESSQQTQETITQSLAGLGSSIDGSFGAVSKIIETNVLTPLQEIVNEKAVGEAQGIASVLEALTAEIGKRKTARDPTTQLIFTREAIAETIAHYLKTAKRRVTIFVPTPEDLPLETLKAVPSSRQVQVICDPGNNPDWHKTLGDSGNIQVYHLSSTARMQPLFAVDREAEEIMIAPAEQEFPVGIISKEEPMIKALTQLLSQARGMASQQQR
ncbi:MAG: helix-turn-helix domain-containing protein [Candidatus Heimdallarchaeota archaeon]